MTERILRALGGTDERYFLAYAEQMKGKNPKKIVLRRWLSAAAAVIVIICIAFALPPVRHTLFPEKHLRWDFDSFEEMMERAGVSPKGDPLKGNIPYDTRLSSLDFSRFDNEHFYICLGDWGDRDGDFTLAMGPPPVYVCELERDGVAYEIAHYQSVNSMEMPERFRNTEKYPNTVSLYGLPPVSYQITRNRSECEFTDVTGYYKIICHTGDKKALSDIVEMLLGQPLFEYLE